MESLDAVNLGPGSRLGLLAELDIPAVATDLDGIIRHWSPAAARLYGRDEDQMLGSSVGALRLSPEDAAIAASIIAELLDVGRWHGEFEIAAASGSPLRLEARAIVLVDHSDQPFAFAVALTDVSERVAAERRAGALDDVRVSAADRLREVSQFWQGALDSLAAHIAILDERGDIVAVNAAWSRFSETEDGGSDYIGRNYIEVCDAANDPVAAKVARGLKEIIAGERQDLALDYTCHSPSKQRWFLLRATRYAGPGPVHVVMMHADVTERHLAAEQAFLQAALLDQVDVSVIVTDLDLCVSSWNSGAERLYGWTAKETLGRSPGELMLPTAAGASAPIIAALRRKGGSDGEHVLTRKDGSTFLAYVRVQLMSDRDGRPAAFVGISMDISERREAERALSSERDYHRTVTDSMGEGMFTLDVEGRLTYLNPAAESFLGWSSDELVGRDMHALAHNRRSDGSSLPIEECPILSARRDGKLVRVEDDIFIRPDGSELAVAYTASPFATEDGIEGCVVVFEDITVRKAASIEIERDLEKLAWVEHIQAALAEKRFILNAQPIVDLRTGLVAQRELLLRMLPPEGPGNSGELISPGSFLAVAEEFGLVTEIDRWVIDRATELAATGLPVQVNVSGRSISVQGFVDHIETAIERTGADPGTLVFEITETALVSDETAARAFVEGLHRLGCKVALDDFGTGWGGFTYLKQLPIDFLKIDIEFVCDMRTSSASRNVVQAIVNLAIGFGLKTVGEGVEDEETLGLLRELGVDYAQGFHIGAPAPLDIAKQPATTHGVQT